MILRDLVQNKAIIKIHDRQDWESYRELCEKFFPPDSYRERVSYLFYDPSYPYKFFECRRRGMYLVDGCVWPNPPDISGVAEQISIDGVWFTLWKEIEEINNGAILIDNDNRIVVPSKFGGVAMPNTTNHASIPIAEGVFLLFWCFRFLGEE